MKRLKGPDLKMPDVKVPPFAADVYYDLRERRLLPVVALVLVAIVATPFLLGGSEEPLPVETPEQAAESVRLEIEDGSALTVVESKPGLRDYRKRLKGRTPTDPFRQLHTGVPATSQLKSTEVGAVGSGSSSGGGSSGASAGETEKSVTEVEEPGASTGAGTGRKPGGGGGGSGGDGSGGGSGSGGKHPDSSVDTEGMRFFGFRPDVRFGVAGSGDLTLYDDLALGRLLPKKKPLLVFIGVSENGVRAAFDVSPEVTLVRGNGACIGGRQSCRLLFLREGEAADLLTETPGRAFRLKIVRIDFVEVDVPKQSSRSGASGSAKGSMQPRSLGLAQNFSK